MEADMEAGTVMGWGGVGWCDTDGDVKAVM